MILRINGDLRLTKRQNTLYLLTTNEVGMDLKTETIGKVLAIYLEGKFDLQLAIELESKINEILEKGHKYLVFDLTDVKYISSSGLRIFIATMRELNEMGGALKLANLTPQIRKFFEVVGMLDLLAIYPSVDEAVATFD